MSKFTAEHVALLGVISDTELAKRAGVQPATVTYHRKKAGLPPANSPPVAWTQEEDVKLGTMSDVDLALKIGRSVDAVYLRRMRLKIPAHCKAPGQGSQSVVHLRIPAALKAEWVRESREQELTLSAWLLSAIARGRV